MGVGARHRGARLRRRPHLGHRARHRRRGRGDLARRDRRSRSSASSGSTRTTSGRWARPVRAGRARRSSATTAPSAGADGGPGQPGGERPLRRVLEPRVHAVLPPRRRRARPTCPARTSTPAPASSASCAAQRRARRSSTPTSSPRSSTPRSRSPASASATRRAHRHRAARARRPRPHDDLPRQRRRRSRRNEDRGYVLRRIIRRAVRFAYLLGVRATVTAAARRPRASTLMGDAYPDLARQPRLRRRHDRARGGRASAARSTRGSTLLDDELAEPRRRATLAGDVAFKLHDTYGFPLEVTQEIAAERGIDVDLAGFDARSWRRSEISGGKAGKKGDVVREPRPTSSRSSTSSARPSSSAARSSRRRPPCSRSSRRRRRRVDLPRPHAVLRGGRWPGRRHRHDHAPTPARPRCSTPPTRCPASTATSRASSTATIERRPGGHRRDRRRAPRRDPPQPHRHAHPPLGAAQGARRPREAAGLARRARPAALRLQPLRAGHRRRRSATIEDLANDEILANDPVRHYETTKADADRARRHRVLRRQVRRHRARARGRPPLDRAVRRHPRARARRHRPGEDRVGGSIGSNLRRIEAVTGTGPIERLRDEEARWPSVADAARTCRVERRASTASRKRLDEIKALRDEVKALRAQAAAGRSADAGRRRRSTASSSHASTASTATACATSRVALRDAAGVRAVVLGGGAGGRRRRARRRGHRRTAASTPAS